MCIAREMLPSFWYRAHESVRCPKRVLTATFCRVCSRAPRWPSHVWVTVHFFSECFFFFLLKTVLQPLIRNPTSNQTARATASRPLPGRALCILLTRLQVLTRPWARFAFFSPTVSLLSLLPYPDLCHDFILCLLCGNSLIRLSVTSAHPALG